MSRNQPWIRCIDMSATCMHSVAHGRLDVTSETATSARCSLDQTHEQKSHRLKLKDRSQEAADGSHQQACRIRTLQLVFVRVGDPMQDAAASADVAA